jgi:hypothetical protein
MHSLTLAFSVSRQLFRFLRRVEQRPGRTHYPTPVQDKMDKYQSREQDGKIKMYSTPFVPGQGPQAFELLAPAPVM